jgi:hypothetical protein
MIPGQKETEFRNYQPSYKKEQYPIPEKKNPGTSAPGLKLNLTKPNL